MLLDKATSREELVDSQDESEEEEKIREQDKVCVEDEEAAKFFGGGRSYFNQTFSGLQVLTFKYM